MQNGSEKVIAYYSRALTRPEKNYCVTRRELLAVVNSIKHLNHYLYGRAFTVRTDHAALQWLRRLKEPDGQLARWIAQLDQHEFEIRFRAGRSHGNADSLSRRPCCNSCRYCRSKERTYSQVERDPSDATSYLSHQASANLCEPSLQHKGTSDPAECQSAGLTDVSLGDIREVQEEDEGIGPILQSINQKNSRPEYSEITQLSQEAKYLWSQWDHLRVQNGALQRSWESPSGVHRHRQVIIPRLLRSKVLKHYHDSTTGGHLGTKKTLGKLRQRFYWPGMRSDVKEWCKACTMCCAKRGPPRAGAAPLQLYVSGAPMERVAVDIAGPLPVTKRGNRYICVAMDYFTKWPEAFALPSQDAATVAQGLIDNFFSRFGVPFELHSDQGRNFESKVFQECCQILDIRKTRTTPMHPQSDGMVEKFNWTLGQELAKFSSQSQDNWDEQLPILLMAYRSAEHEVTDQSPAKMMMGHELRLPADIMIGRPPDTLNQSTSEFTKRLREDLRRVHEHVRTRLQIAADAMKLRHDSRANSVTLEVGTDVWVHNPKRLKGKSPKLMRDWEGPYEVIAGLSDVTYRVRRKGQRKMKVVHSNRLGKYHHPHFSWDEPEAASSLPSSSNPSSAPSDTSAASDECSVADRGALANHARHNLRRDRRPPARFGDFITHLGQV